MGIKCLQRAPVGLRRAVVLLTDDVGWDVENNPAASIDAAARMLHERKTALIVVAFGGNESHRPILGLPASPLVAFRDATLDNATRRFEAASCGAIFDQNETRGTNRTHSLA